ncbi:MAG TPA: ThiF family adenylyltransferase, partial [Chloroflexota bacterium]|nr:ThiF family adenylyltransferase [Chloroflexota bacterium]
AGGTASLYALSSFPRLTGEPVIVEPGRLKVSNLGRYLMSTYDQVHGERSKLASVAAFLDRHAPELHPRLEPAPWHAVAGPWDIVICAVDTPEARWDVQRSCPRLIIEAGVMGLLYSVLRVVPGGWCLECKIPRDPDLTWKRRALRWGLTVEEIRRRFAGRVPVTAEDLARLADVQGRPAQDFAALLGRPFDELPSLTECGETPLSLSVPSQAPVLPLVTTAAGVVVAAEVVKEVTGVGAPLHNVFDHDLRFAPRPKRRVFRPRRPDCPGCRTPGG